MYICFKFIQEEDWCKLKFKNVYAPRLELYKKSDTKEKDICS